MSYRGVLLVHVDAEVQEVAQRVLGRIGVEVDATNDPEAAAARIAEQPYAVVLIADRDEALIAAIGRRTPRPFVIVTAEANIDSDVISLVVPTAYDPHTLVGVVLASVNEALPPPSANGVQERLPC